MQLFNGLSRLNNLISSWTEESSEISVIIFDPMQFQCLSMTEMMELDDTRFCG